jgi:hypothetical protein
VRLCLYITGPDGVERLAARYDYAPSEGDEEPVPALTVREAKAILPRILRRDYGSRFKNRRHFRRSCFRYTTEKVRCKVRWDWRSFRYRGSVTMRNDPADADSVLCRTNIRRKRMHSNDSTARTCDPNYSGCLRPNASDYDCAGGSGDGPYYTGPVRVLGDDHYDLDRDGDGVACEDD